MLELVSQAVTALQAETANYPDGVQTWMRLMGLSFAISIAFVYSRAGARWILAALILNILGLVIGKMLFPELSRTVIGTCVHLLFWPAILWMVWRSVKARSHAQNKTGLFHTIYLAWLGWSVLLMVISLLFDLRSFIQMLA